MKQIIAAVLSQKRVTTLILAIIVVSRVLQLLYLFNTRNDMSYQILAAQALYEGHGVNSTTVSADDLSTLHYRPLVGWPPGFSVLLLPFYALYGQNYLAAALTLNILSALVTIFFGRRILKLLEMPLHLINLFTILTGFSIYYFYLKPCTDSIAIAFLIMAVYYTISLYKSSQQAFKKNTAIGLTLMCCAFVKYLYTPVVFVFPVLILAEGFYKKKRYLKISGSTLLVILLVACLSFFIYQKLSSGAIGYIKEPERGFYPENLLSAHPFIPASLIKPETLEWFFNWAPQAASLILRFFQIGHLFVFLSVVFLGIRNCVKQGLQQDSVIGSFFYLALIVSFAVFAILVWLSINVAKEDVDGGLFWTYVEEPRYYGAINIFIHLIVFISLPLIRHKRSKYVFYFFFFCMLGEAVRGAIFTANRALHFGKEQYGWQQELKFQQNTAALVNQEKKKQRADKIVLIGSSDWMTIRAALYCSLPIFEDVTRLNNLSALHAKEPVMLFAIIRKDHVIYFDTFVNSNKTRFAGSGEGFLFYTHTILPN